MYADEGIHPPRIILYLMSVHECIVLDLDCKFAEHPEQEHSVTLHNQIMISCVPEAEVAVLAAAAAAQPGA